MSTEMHDEDKPAATTPPPIEVDEGYWSALLHEGEFTGGTQPALDGNGWNRYDEDQESVPQDNSQSYASQHDWMLAKTTCERDETVELVVTGYNRGGLLVSWNSLRGFVPASQLIDFPVELDEIGRREALSRRVGQSLQLRIIELDIAMNRLILSERAAQVQPGQRADVLAKLQEGDTCEGTVTNVCDFGAFVDLGGVEGLIHISELSWGRVGHPRDVLSGDQKVKVFVMSVDPEEERIALSLKRLQPDPWESVEKRYQVGQTVEGVVTNVVDFGAFACIEEGLEGLIHVSELAEGQFLHPRNVVKEGDKVVACILNIDGPARRLGLSLRTSDNGDGPGAPYAADGFPD